MKTNTGPSSRIREALRTIRGIAQEIVDAAADPSRRLSDLFAEAAIQKKVDACMGLALAVAACGRCKWLREVRREIEETAAVVVAADNALAPRITLNPEMMNHVIGAEQKVFDLLLAASLKVLVLAKLARMMRTQLATYLHKEYVSIRIELLHWERERNAEREVRSAKSGEGEKTSRDAKSKDGGKHESPILIGTGFPFIEFCDPENETLRMRIKRSNGAEDAATFKIRGEERWYYVLQFAKASKNRIVLKPYRKGKSIDLFLVFRENKGCNHVSFYRFTRTTGGKKPWYWLEQTQQSRRIAR